MVFRVGFDDPRLLAQAARLGIVGALPRLRFVNLLPRAVVEPIVATLPEHIARRVVLEPDARTIKEGPDALVAFDIDGARTRFPTVDPERIVAWSSIPPLYAQWHSTSYRQFRADIGLYLPEGLFPADWRWPPLELAVMAGEPVATRINTARCAWAPALPPNLELRPSSAASNDAHAALLCPDFPSQYTPTRATNTLDDHDRLLDAACSQLMDDLDSAIASAIGVPTWVVGFVEPLQHLDGSFFHERASTNARHVVRRLNDALITWCAARHGAHFVDGDAIAATIGKLLLDLDRVGLPDGALPPYQPLGSMSDRFFATVLRTVCHELVELSEVSPVSCVILDLDTPLWEGLQRPDYPVSNWANRWHGLTEMVWILQGRGIKVAAISRNDESFLRHIWTDLLDSFTDAPIEMSISLDDFDALRIDVDENDKAVGELLCELGIDQEHAVFIDADAADRERVMARFPMIRTLGDESMFVRSELLYSPFTQHSLVHVGAPPSSVGVGR